MRATRRTVTAALAHSIGRTRLAALRRVGRVAKRLGDRAFLVGGVVRDALLGRRSADLDVVIEGPTEALTGALGPGAVHHPAFHTATLTLAGGQRIDVARARVERYPRPGALPRVTPASIEQDLGRRDFTVNAIAVRLDPGGFGEVYDPLGGIADLAAKRLRVLHDLSFIDDPTRAFRAVRLAARLGFSIDARSARLLRAAVRGGAVDTLSPARLRDQIELLFSELDPVAGLRLLARYGLLLAIDPDLRTLPRTRIARLPTLLRRHAARCAAQPVRPWLVALAATAMDLKPPAIERLCARVGASRHERDVLRQAPNAPKLVRLLGPGDATPSRIYRICHGQLEEVLILALAAAPGGAVPHKITRYLEHLAAVRPDIDGRDLLRAGVRPGPRVAVGLAAALAAKLDGAARDPEAQLAAALHAALRA